MVSPILKAEETTEILHDRVDLEDPKFQIISKIHKTLYPGDTNLPVQMVQNLVLRVPNVVVHSDDGVFEPEVIVWSIRVVELATIFNKLPRVEMCVLLK